MIDAACPFLSLLPEENDSSCWSNESEVDELRRSADANFELIHMAQCRLGILEEYYIQPYYFVDCNVVPSSVLPTR